MVRSDQTLLRLFKASGATPPEVDEIERDIGRWGRGSTFIEVNLPTPGATSTQALYHRERVLAVAQSTEGRDAKRRWDETVRGNTPGLGWTTRLGDMGCVLGKQQYAAGKY
jgi:hypothetical protein